jgi:hypothetical protein
MSDHVFWLIFDLNWIIEANGTKFLMKTMTFYVAFSTFMQLSLHSLMHPIPPFQIKFVFDTNNQLQTY